ncbi:hypothetical protein [Tautonia sociabilis]|uniref:DUF3102 domain-containing protein n=1 Tax=Tautonia sociabilis TaxID=2080755 RepID=A0A432MD53_9BACT|nr:hypothetical protein [Tautonia sociabilis]RUL81294.1 hypothetical protein TsocGM_25295 [Tautonia sociabilis]
MNVAHDTATDNSAHVAEEQAREAQGTPAAPAGNAFPDATEAEQKQIADYKATESEVVDLAVATLDPKDMLKKYARLGKAVLSLAARRKASFKAWAKEDFAKVCDDLATLVKMRVAIKEVEMDKYVRIHLWVEAVKPLVPAVEKLSYFQVKNKFLPTLAFDPVELTGEIRKEWLTWVRATVERQVGDEPLSIKELDQSIADQKKAVEDARNARKDPEKLLEQERKAVEAKAKKERRDAQQGIVDAIDGAVTNGHADTSDVLQIVEQVLKANNLSLPAKVVGFDPINCTVADCKMLAQAMIGAGKLAEAKVLRDTLDAMIKIAEHAMLNRAAS